MYKNKYIFKMFYLLILITILPFKLLSMNYFFDVNNPEKNIIPKEIQSIIFAQPDYALLTEIITIQKKINQLQSNTDYKIKKPTQKSFLVIQKALFPCFAITQTCKKFNAQDFKTLIAQISLNFLLEVFPEGIALFLLPKPLQINFFDQYCQQVNDDLCEIINVCFNRKNEFDYCNTMTKLPYNSILNNPNTIIYVKSGFKGFEPHIESYTIIEYILHRLSYNIAYAGRVSDYFPNTQGIKKYWEKFFIVIDFFCSLPTIDLSLPAAQSNKTIAQEINAQFHRRQYPTDLFSEESQNKLNNPVSSEAVIQEQQFLLQILAQTYLGLTTKDEQEEYLKYRLKKESEEKTQKAYKQKEKTKEETAKKINLKNLIKASIISILFFITIICIFKKNIIHDTYFSVIHPFCKLFYHW